MGRESREGKLSPDDKGGREGALGKEKQPEKGSAAETRFLPGSHRAPGGRAAGNPHPLLGAGSPLPAPRVIPAPGAPTLPSGFLILLVPLALDPGPPSQHGLCTATTGCARAVRPAAFWRKDPPCPAVQPQHCPGAALRLRPRAKFPKA